MTEANMLKARSAGGKKKSRKRSPYARKVAIFLLLVFTLAIGAGGYAMNMRPDEIAGGVALGPIDVGRRTTDEAKTLLRERVAALRIPFSTDKGRIVLAPATSLGGGFAVFRIDEAVTRAATVGRTGGTLRSIAERINAGMFGKWIKVPVALDKAALRTTLEKHFSGQVRPARNARLEVRLTAAGDASIGVIPEEEGTDLDYERAITEAEDRLAALGDGEIRLVIRKDPAELTVADVEPLRNDVDDALARTPLTIKAKGQEWTVSKQTLAGWLDAVPTGTRAPKARLGLDRTKMERFLADKAEIVAIEPKNAKFEMADGRVTVFDPSINGESLDMAASIAAIEKALFAADGAGPAEAGLVIATVEPAMTTERSNPFGIKEVIGVGATNFAGSPRNRRHNIAIGAKSLDGLLVAPGEEFSLLKALGDIDGAAGYLQELVIKENKTVPEYGGGLCQIGSTAFRTVLASGLPVTERRNHSYRVPYYERDGEGKYIGPGKDATIYDPAPDFKFVNDTGRHILIKTLVDGNKVEFSFWGVRDGRTSEQTDAITYNVVKPPEKKIVETADLPPGTTKCTEKPHVGSDAVFTYTVTYPDGEVKKTDFKSHYRPWQEVCLVGVDPATLAPGSGMDADGVPSADASGATGN